MEAEERSRDAAATTSNLKSLSSLGLSGNNLITQACLKTETTFTRLVDNIRPDLNKLFVTKLAHGNQFEILSYINVTCSYAELLTLFYVSESKQFITTMKEFYGKQFINGDIICFFPERELVIKRGCFKSVLSHYRNWVYIEHYHYIPNGIVITLDTINGTDRHMINGLFAAYTIKLLPATNNLHRNSVFTVMFRGKIDCSGDKKHLIMLAKGLRKISDIITNHQISIQRRANLSTCNVNKKYCVSCVRLIFCHRLPYFKYRCDLCSYYICQQCSHKRIVFNQTQSEALTLCSRCLTRLKYCDYSNICDQTMTARIIIPENDSHDAGSFIFDYLQKNKELTGIQRMIKRIMKSDVIDMNSLFTYLTDHPSQEDCIVSPSSFSRSYPLDMPDFTSELDRIITPLPVNESERLAAVQRANPESLIRNEDLMRLCEIANLEFNNFTTVISMIVDENVVVLASADHTVIQSYDRSESICQHIVMDGKPLLVVNPEANIKYYNLPSIQALGIRFYFSVPIFLKDNYIIGTLCTIDTTIKQVTVSQYSLMRKLSGLASTIIEDPKRILQP